MGRSQCTISVLPLVWFQNKQESLRSSGKKEEIDKKRSTFFWEQRKFSEIAQRESTAKKSSTDFPSVEYEDVVSEVGILNKDVRLKETQKTGICFDGSQVLYGKLRPYLHNWLSPDFSGVAVGDWWVLKPVNVDKSFLFRLIQTEKFDDIANQSSGSKMPRADWNLLSNTEFMVPAEIEEERKIGQYFSELDHLITLHQSKAKLWNFVRFSRSPISWEQRKLAELATFSKGTGYSKSDLKESGTPIILYGRLYTKYETTIKDVDTFAEPKNGSTYSASGEVIVPASGETAEDISIASVVEKPGVLLGGDLNIIHPNYNIDPTFLAISVSNGEPHMDMARRAQGKSVVHLHNEDLAQIELRYPSITEQKKIGKYFNGIDHLITLHQRKKRYIEYYRNRGIFYAWI